MSGALSCNLYQLGCLSLALSLTLLLGGVLDCFALPEGFAADGNGLGFVDEPIDWGHHTNHVRNYVAPFFGWHPRAPVSTAPKTQASARKGSKMLTEREAPVRVAIEGIWKFCHRQHFNTSKRCLTQQR